MGTEYENQGWVVVGEEPPLPKESTPEELAWERAKKLLSQSDWAMLPDVPMNKAKRAEWVEYRMALRDIRSDENFPDLEWPKSPE